MRTLHPHTPGDTELGLRILELLKVNPATVSAYNMHVHRNHVTFQVFQRDHDGEYLVNERRSEMVTKTRTRRNPLPGSHLKKGN